MVIFGAAVLFAVAEIALVLVAIERNTRWDK